MSSPSKAWDRFFYAPASGYRVAWTRVLLGSYLLGYFGAYGSRVTLAFSNQGVQVPYLVPNYAPSPAVAYVLYGLTLGLCGALLFGYRTRLTAPLLLLSFGYHYFLHIAVKQSSFERVIAVMLLVMCFADSGRVLGLDVRRPGPPPIAWAERTLQLQTVLLYFGSGFWKLLTPAWHAGVLLRSNMQGMFATPLAYAIVRQPFSEQTWTLFSWSVIGFELLLPVLFVLRPTRPLAIVLGLGFHLFNCVVLSIPEFLICATAYPLFVEPATLERATTRITQLFARRAPTRPRASA